LIDENWVAAWGILLLEYIYNNIYARRGEERRG
jgi:hypothetical protein